MKILPALVLVLLCGDAAAQLPRRDPLPPLRPEQTALLQRVDSLRLARQPREAIDALLPEVEAARAERDSVYLLQLLVRIGQERAAYGAGAAAEEPLREALALADRVRDPRAHLRALRWLGVAFSNQGRMEEARALADSLLRSARCEQDRYYEGWARVGLGWYADTHGRSEAAITEYRQAAQDFRLLEDAWSESWAQNSLGIAEARLGRYAEATAGYTRAAELARSVDYLMVEAMARNNLGTLAYSLGDPGLATAEFRRARAIHLRVGNPREATYPVINEALCLFALGREERALALLDSLLEVTRAGRYPDLLARVLSDRAQLSARQGQRHEAAAFYRQALSIGDDLPHKSRLEASIGLAALLAEVDSVEAGIELLDRTAAAYEMPRQSETWVEFQGLLGRLQVAAASAEPRRVEAGLARLVDAAHTADSLGLQGYRVRDLSEAARACRKLGRPAAARRLLEEAADAWEAERGVPLEPEWREIRGASGREIYTELADLLLEDGAAGAFERLQEFKARTLSERLRGPGARPDDPDGAPPARFSLDHLQCDVLRPGELLLDFYGGPRLSLLFAVTNDSLRAVRLPGEEELRPAIRALRELLSTPPGDDSASAGAALRACERLTRPLLADVQDLTANASRIFLAPDGVFHLLPWEALSGSVWSRLPSAALLGTLREGAPSRAKETAVRILAARGPSGEPPTAGTTAEIDWLRRSIRGASPVEVQRDRSRRASTDSVGESDAVSRPSIALRRNDRVLHVAGHITISDESPWQSEIRFGAAPGERIRAGELADVKLPARLTVLSGCSSAGGRVLSGEGVPGLASACLAAGAQAVVASLWPVEDAAAARLVSAFYRRLAGGETVDAALASARAELRRDPSTRHPFYWASFVTVGDGAQVVPIRPRSKWRNPALGAGVLLLLAVLLFLPRRSRP